jgi:hypothetical protein
VIYPGRLGPLLAGVAARQELSRTAQVQASLSRPGDVDRPAAPVLTGSWRDPASIQIVTPNLLTRGDRA